LRPYRELKWAIRELSALIRESRSFNIWELGSASRRRGGSRWGTLPSPPERRIAKQIDYPTPVPPASPDHDAKARGRCRRRSQSRDCTPFPRRPSRPDGLDNYARPPRFGSSCRYASVLRKNFLTLRLPSATRWTNSNLRRSFPLHVVALWGARYPANATVAFLRASSPFRDQVWTNL